MIGGGGLKAVSTTRNTHYFWSVLSLCIESSAVASMAGQLKESRGKAPVLRYLSVSNYPP